MSLTIDMNTNEFDDLVNLLKRDHKRAVVKSVKRAINRTTPAMKKAVAASVSAKYKITKAKVNKNYTKVRKRIRGFDINTLEGEVSISGQSIPMILFVKGKKTPRKQKGIPVAKRRGFKLEVERGKTRKSGKRVFIARGRQTDFGKYQVYRRDKDAKAVGRRRQRMAKPMKRQSITSPAVMFRRGSSMRDPVMNAMGKRFQHEFMESLRGLMKQMAAKG